MPSGDNINSKETLAKYRKPISDSEKARDMQRKSADKRTQNNKEKLLIKEELCRRLKAKDLTEIADGLIERAKHNSRDFEVLQEALGQKPSKKIDIGEETISSVKTAYDLTMEEKIALITKAAADYEELTKLPF